MNAIKQGTGFTLLEALFVIMIMGILTMGAIPFYTNFTEGVKINSLSSELFNDLNLAKVSAISVGRDYKFTFLENGWEITSDDQVVKRKTIRDDSLYIAQEIESLIFEPLGFTKDKDGNTIARKKWMICNNITFIGYQFEINSFGKAKTKDIRCD